MKEYKTNQIGRLFGYGKMKHVGLAMQMCLKNIDNHDVKQLSQDFKVCNEARIVIGLTGALRKAASVPLMKLFIEHYISWKEGTQ